MYYFACFIDTCSPRFSNQLCVDFTCAVMFVHFSIFTSKPSINQALSANVRSKCLSTFAATLKLHKRKKDFIHYHIHESSKWSLVCSAPSRGESLYLIRNKIQEFVAANYTFLPKNSSSRTRQRRPCRLQSDSQWEDVLIPLDLWSCGRRVCPCLTRKHCFWELQKQKKNGAPTFPGQDKIESVWRGSRGITVVLQAECTLLAPCWEKHA